MEPEKNSKDVVNLVIARLESMPSNVSVSIGGQTDSYTIKELIERVRKQDDIGQKMTEMQLNYIRSWGRAPANA